MNTDYRNQLKAAQAKRNAARAKEQAEKDQRTKEQEASEGLALMQVLDVFGIDPVEELTKNEYILDGVRYSAHDVTWNVKDQRMHFTLVIEKQVPQVDENPFFNWYGNYRELSPSHFFHNAYGALNLSSEKDVDFMRAELADILDAIETDYTEQLPKYEAWLAKRNQPAPAETEPHTRLEFYGMSNLSNKHLSHLIDKGYSVISMSAVNSEGETTAIVMLSKHEHVLPQSRVISIDWNDYRNEI